MFVLPQSLFNGKVFSINMLFHNFLPLPKTNASYYKKLSTNRLRHIQKVCRKKATTKTVVAKRQSSIQRQLIKRKAREANIRTPLMLFIAAGARPKIQNGENGKRAGP